MKTPTTITHEQYIQRVAKIAMARKELSDKDRGILAQVKLCYGAGVDGVRGVTYYDRWNRPDGTAPFVELSAFVQESIVQLVGTTIHELGHCIAKGEGHGKGWHEACERLGLSGILAAGTNYEWTMLSSDIRAKIQALPEPNEGRALNGPSLVGQLFGAIPGAPAVPTIKSRPCGAGYGTKGGRSRGAGSGSRLRLFECECSPPVKVRASRDFLNATCNCCTGMFQAR